MYLFTKRLMSHLALKGTEITHQELNPPATLMHVKLMNMLIFSR
jgi:hypothetical protein